MLYNYYLSLGPLVRYNERSAAFYGAKGPAKRNNMCANILQLVLSMVHQMLTEDGSSLVPYSRSIS
jgi:hypothetical protein